MKAYRTFAAAIKANTNPTDPILRVGDLYIVGAGNSTCTEFAVIDPTQSKVRPDHLDYPITGHVSISHLRRLGNANWATPRKEKA